jgi:hypothetical protein
MNSRSAIASVLLLLTPCVHAALVEVVNPSFESPSILAGTFQTAAPATGWSNYAYIDVFAGRDVGVLNPSTTVLYADPVPHGANVAVVFLLTGGPTESGIQQTLSAPLVANMQYTLNVHVGNIAPDGGPFNFAGFPGYRVALMAGGQEIAFDNNTLAPGEGRFLESTVQFTTGAAHAFLGQPLGIRLVSLDGPSGIEVNFDNVRLDAVAVPEPSTWGLAIGGMLLMMAVKRCRNRCDKR